MKSVDRSVEGGKVEQETERECMTAWSMMDE